MNLKHVFSRHKIGCHASNCSGDSGMGFLFETLETLPEETTLTAAGHKNLPTCIKEYKRNAIYKIWEIQYLNSKSSCQKKKQGIIDCTFKLLSAHWLCDHIALSLYCNCLHVGIKLHMLMPSRPNGTALQAGLTLSCFKTPCSAHPPSVLSECPVLGANVELIWKVHLQHQQWSDIWSAAPYDLSNRLYLLKHHTKGNWTKLFWLLV